MASAICPNCNVLLVEADNNSLTNPGTAVNQAVTSGATVVSNSYGSTDKVDATNSPLPPTRSADHRQHG